VGDGGDAFELWFRKRLPGSTYTLRSTSAQVRRDWVHDISCLLWKQALHNRNQRKAELLCEPVDARPPSLLSFGSTDSMLSTCSFDFKGLFHWYLCYCFVTRTCLQQFAIFSSAFLQYYDAVGWVFWPVKPTIESENRLQLDSVSTSVNMDRLTMVDNTSAVGNNSRPWVVPQSIKWLSTITRERRIHPDSESGRIPHLFGHLCPLI